MAIVKLLVYKMLKSFMKRMYGNFFKKRDEIHKDNCTNVIL